MKKSTRPSPHSYFNLLLLSFTHTVGILTLYLSNNPVAQCGTIQQLNCSVLCSYLLLRFTSLSRFSVLLVAALALASLAVPIRLYIPLNVHSNLWHPLLLCNLLTHYHTRNLSQNHRHSYTSSLNFFYLFFRRCIT